jgi:hypothetical protein
MSNQGPGEKIPERRRHRRYRITSPVKFRQSVVSITVEGLTQEISEGGLSAFVGPGLAVGETVDVDLSLPGLSLQASAIVRSCTGTHFRFEFVGLTPEQVQQIKDCNKKLDPFRSIVMHGARRPRS